MNKTIILLPLAFVLGGMAGYIGPSEKLRAFKAKVADEAKASPSRSVPGAASFGPFAKFVNIPERAEPKKPRRAEPAADRPTRAAPAASAPAASVPDEPVDAPEESAPEDAEFAANSPEDPRAALEKASQIWGARADVVRGQLVARLQLDAAGAAKRDESLTAMNERIRESMQAAGEMLTGQNSMTPELAFRLMGDFSTALAETYDDLGAIAGEEHRAEISQINLVDFIDPMVGEPLIAVQDKLDPRALEDNTPQGGSRR